MGLKLKIISVLGAILSTVGALAHGGEDSLPRYYFSDPIVKIEVRYIQPFHRLSGILDSTFFQLNYSADIGRALLANGQVNAYQYGPQGTACLIRMNGLSPDHTHLTWKGISLNSLTLGQMDFSLVPAFFFDHLTTGSSKSIENGANVGFGGNVDLNQSFHGKAPKFRYWNSFNSLNNYSSGGEVNFHRGTLEDAVVHHQIKWLTGNFKNDFTYDWKDILGERKLTQINNDVVQRAWLYRTQVSKGNHQWQAHYWMIDRQAQLPNTMGNFSSFLQEQDDLNHRWLVGYSKQDYNSERLLKNWSIQYAGTTDVQHYRMKYSFEGNTDWSRSSTAIQQHWLSSQFHLRFREIWQYVKLNTRNVRVQYQDMLPISQNIYQLLYDARWLGRRFNYYCVADRQYWGKQSNDQIEATAEWVKGVINPQENRNYFRAQLAAFYQQRMPDFNERYWPGSGNVNLLQETGKGVKSFVEWVLKPDNRFFGNLTFDLEYNQRWVSNWIQWVPQNSGLWAPINLSYVQAKSLNSNLQFKLPVAIGMIKNRVFMQWNKVTIQNDLNNLDSEKSSILPYTPNWKWGGESTIMFNNHFYFTLAYRWTGLRYTDEANQMITALPDYQIFDLNFGDSSMNQAIQWSVGVDNILNEQYQEVRSYALPGRVYKMQLNISIK